MNKKIQNFLFALVFMAFSFKGLIFSQCSSLDFDTAVDRVLNQSWQLKLAETEIHAKAAERKQASLYPNPIFSYDVEGIGVGRPKEWRGLGGQDVTYEVSQLVELGGKRRLRQRLASYQHDAARVDYEISQLTLLNRFSKAFIDAVAAQERYYLAREQAKIAKESLYAVLNKLEAGKVSLIQKSKAEIAYSTAGLVEDQARVDFLTAKEQLAYLWGSTCLDFEQLDYPFYEIEPPLPLTDYLTEFCNQPELVKAHLNYLASQKAVDLERAIRIPDLTVTVGYTTGNDAYDNGLVVGVAFPLPIFDRNQGNVSRAYLDVTKTEIQLRELWLVLESKVSIAHKELLRAYQEGEKLRRTILKSAHQAFDFAYEGYHLGKFEYLDLLDAQRTLFEIKQRYIEALVHYHYSKANIQYLNSQTE